MTPETTSRHSPAYADEPLVRFIDVQKTYDGESLVVNRLNLDIHRGEFMTLLGPSGSGKTTTLMMLAGFESPTHGEITLAGRSIKGVPPHKRNIGVVFQNYALFPHMTVGENVAFPLTVRKMDKAEVARRVHRTLEMVQLADFHHRHPSQLSGGQQQRVALARALVFEPHLVLMDEPLGALDKQLRERMQIEIKHLHLALGVTVVYVTHDQSEALTMSDRIAVFHDGKLQQVADPSALYEEPANAFVAQFIGENNRFHGRVVRLEGDECEVELDRGGTVHARPVNIGVGDRRTSLSLRPERVVVDPDPQICPNRFEGVVHELIYLGDHIRARLSVAGNDDFIIKVSNNGQTARLREKDRVTVGWSVGDCRALDAYQPSAGETEEG